MSNHRIPDVSILVCAYNMQRELPRTLFTLSKSYQRNLEGITCEVVVLDNGSSPAVDEEEIRKIIPDVRVIRPEVCLQSPACAINKAMRELKGRLLGLWIDGARLASPGLVARALDAWRADASKAIGTLAFHLGPDVQVRSVGDGYSALVEDSLLASIPWKKNGYQLFQIAVPASSSAAGWFGCMNETNGFFVDREFWSALGGLDERFSMPGGGYVNLDLWARAVAASNNNPWVILGEATFHQVHGGASSNGGTETRIMMRDEYVSIKCQPFQKLDYRARYVGSLDDEIYFAGSTRQLDRYRKVHTVRGRAFRVGLNIRQLSAIQTGTLSTSYKGLRLAKNPFDLALYLQVIQKQRPRTIIEVGTSEGGSAVWLIDQCKAVGLPETRLITIDLKPPKLMSDGVEFFYGDATDPEHTFPHAALQKAPHPWLVIEDSAHTYLSTSATLNYFDMHMRIGDRIVIEDGVVADLEGDLYRGFEDGPNHAVAAFLTKTGSRYIIDAETCDFYGQNLTYAPNAWLIRQE